MHVNELTWETRGGAVSTRTTRRSSPPTPPTSGPPCCLCWPTGPAPPAPPSLLPLLQHLQALLPCTTPGAFTQLLLALCLQPLLSAPRTHQHLIARSLRSVMLRRLWQQPICFVCCCCDVYQGKQNGTAPSALALKILRCLRHSQGDGGQVQVDGGGERHHCVVPPGPGPPPAGLEPFPSPRNHRSPPLRPFPPSPSGGPSLSQRCTLFFIVHLSSRCRLMRDAELQPTC